MGGEWGVSWLSVTLVRCREVGVGDSIFLFFFAFSFEAVHERDARRYLHL